MALLITILGEDILCFSVAGYLDPVDIFNFSLGCRCLRRFLTSNNAYHLLYVKKFGSDRPTPLNLDDYNWKQLFDMRVSLKLNFYTWGAASFGRLGYLLSDVPKRHLSLSRLYKAVHTPTKVVNFERFRIKDISAGGFTFLILTGDGKLYFTGGTRGAGPPKTPGPNGRGDHRIPPSDGGSTLMPPYNEQGWPIIRPGQVGIQPVPQSGARAEHTFTQPPPAPAVRPTNPNLTQPPENLDFLVLESKTVEETPFVTQLHLPPREDEDTKFIAVSCGRDHFIALDNYSNLYTWDTGSIGKTGVKLSFPHLPKKPITKIFAGWNLSVVHMKDVGLVVIYSRDAIQEPDALAGRLTVNARFFVIPDSKDTTDFVALVDCVIFVKNGLLYRYDIHAETYFRGDVDTLPEDAFECYGFNNWLEDHNAQIAMTGSFTKLTGCYKDFAVFSSDGLVLLGNRHSTRRFEGEVGSDRRREPEIIPELQNKHIIHVVKGDYHSLALTDEGKLLSWGRESNECGCLGLGGDMPVTVEKPTLVPKPSAKGKWMAVCAAGWHSGGLFFSDDDEDSRDDKLNPIENAGITSER